MVDAIPDPSCNISTAIVDGVANSPWVKSSVSGTLLYNNIDDMKNPHSGLYATFTTEFAGLGGDAEFIKVTGRGTYYHTLSEEMNLVGLADRRRRTHRRHRRLATCACSTISRTATASSAASNINGIGPASIAK